MPLISSLKTSELKNLLRERELVTTGNKVELIKRLTEFEGSEEVEYESENTNDNVREEINDLRNMIENVLSVVQQSFQNPQASNASQNRRRQSRDEPSPNREYRQRNNYSVREIADTLPEYDPTKDAIFSVNQFIDRVEKSLRAYEWDEKCLMLAIYTKLKGPAKLWLDASADLYVSWHELANALKEEFQSESDEADIHFKMSNATRKNGESINEYCFRMNALGKRHNLSDSSIIKYTREGLKHRELQAAIATIRFKSMKEMRETLDEYFMNMPSCSSNARPVVTQKHNSFPPGKISNRTGDTSKTGVERKPVICFNCAEAGHISSACPKPQKRQRCKDCQRVHPRGSPENCGKPYVRSSNNVRKISTDKKITVNGLEMCALIDTGSECSMISKSKTSQIEGNRKSCNVYISGVCGGTGVLSEMISTKLRIDNVEILANLYVADDDIFSADIIIGNDIFLTNNIRLICDNKEQRFEYLNVAKTEMNAQARYEIADIKHGEIDKLAQSMLHDLIHKYEDVFGNEVNKLGLTNAVKMKITLTTNEPIVTKPYRLPEMKKESVRKIIDDLLVNDIIRKSKSEYASPIVLVKKKNGDDRLCVDYRRLNQHMAKEIFPTPNIEERLQEVMKFKIFTVLDLNSGYYQIPIEENSQKFTAFVTPDGMYEFKRMPFGLKNAPAVFQRLMALIKEKTKEGDIVHYMDDIVVGSNEINEMFEKLDRVFNILRSLNLTINIKKCEFLKQNVEFLGHQIHSEGMSPGAAKTNAILEFPTPTNVREVRQFLGLSGYFRKFVPGYALTSEPLRSLLKKDAIFQWKDEQENAFCSLRKSLTTSPVIVGYKTSAEHQIHTDASSIGIAGVLLQKENDAWKPVAFFSRSTTTQEHNYHSYELETLAVVETLERFKYYVYGKNVVVVTDCSAIKTAMQKKELIPRIARWWLRIQDFDINIEHRSGQRMPHVDALSRAPYEVARDPDTASLRIAKTTITEGDMLLSMQLQDEHIADIITKLKAGDKTFRNDYSVRDNGLFRKVNDKCLWVVPRAIRWRIIQGQHDNTGHLGVEKTLTGLQKHFWFPRMRNAVKAHIKACVECAYNKSSGGKHEGEYHHDKVNPIPFHTVHMDHLGPFTKTTKRNEHILVIVDAFTKFTVIKAVKSTATKHVLAAVNEMSEYFGMPSRLITDRGSAFTSCEFTKYCKDNDIKHIRNAVRTPRANGHAERTNRTILSMLRPSADDDKHWDDQLRRIQWALNTMKNKTTGQTPQQLLFGFEPRDILQNKLLLALHNTEMTTPEQLQKIRNEAADNIEKQREKAKQRYDAQHSQPRKYKESELVLVENEPASTGASRKLEPRYKGPFIVTTVLDKDRYVIEDLPGSSRTQRHYKSIYASDKMKPWCSLPEIEDDEPDQDGEYLHPDDEEGESNRGRLK